ncbi:hypothetical protein Krac_8353 [Ktedonobacter racemifer DSM 44963]|uniref:Uncharacterized protein n=1 Tax=Ktedonobacter racemifer DSM 44963 TaxID=485913 RepID=D6TMN2_KTERA|nr:hypothetical protein Krac_8353 [Ktedonobacter racemifer DSM 44963]
MLSLTFYIYLTYAMCKFFLPPAVAKGIEFGDTPNPARGAAPGPRPRKHAHCVI